MKFITYQFIQFNMKKLLTLLFILFYSISYSQIYDKPANYGLQYKRVKVDTVFLLPYIDTIGQPSSTVLRPGAMVYRMGDSTLYTWNGIKWRAYGKKITFTSPLTATTFDGSANVTISLSGLTGLGSGNQLLSMNSSGTSYEYRGITFGTTGSVPNVDYSTANTITFNFPSMTSSGVTRGLLSNGTQSIPGAKTFTSGVTVNGGITHSSTSPAVSAQLFNDGVRPYLQLNASGYAAPMLYPIKGSDIGFAGMDGFAAYIYNTSYYASFYGRSAYFMGWANENVELALSPVTAGYSSCLRFLSSGNPVSAFGYNASNGSTQIRVGNAGSMSSGTLSQDWFPSGRSGIKTNGVDAGYDFDVNGILRAVTSLVTPKINNGTDLNVPTTGTTIVAFKSSSVVSSTNLTPTGDAKENYYSATLLATSTTVMNPSGTLSDFNELTIRIKSDGTPRAISWQSVYRGGTIALPSTTTANKTMVLRFLYNSTDSKMDLISYQDNL